MNWKNIHTIIIKELRSYFDSPTAYIVLVLFLFLWEFLFFRNVFLVGEASFRSLFDYLPWLMLLLVPAITMGSISQEKNDGTLELLLTHPLKSLDLIVGKFLASVAFVALALLFVVPLTWTFASFGNFDMGVILGQFLGGVFLSMALIALGVFVSSLFNNQISALLVTVVSGFFLLIAGSSIVTDRLPAKIALFFEQLSLSTHYQSMIRGVIDLRDVWYFVSFVAVFLSLAYLQFMRLKYGNQKKKYRNYVSGVVMLIAIMLLTNVIGSYIPGRIDLTENDMYTLSPATRDIVKNLDDVVYITLYASDELPAQVQTTLRDVQDILRDYTTIGGSEIIFSTKNPSKNDDIAQEAALHGVQPVQFNVIGNEEFQLKTGYLGLTVSYGGEHESIPFLQEVNDLEYQITSFIKQLTDEDKKTIAFLAGHGEKNAMQEYASLYQELSKQFEIQTLTDASGDAPAEDGTLDRIAQEETPQEETSLDLTGVDTLIIAGPTDDIVTSSQETIAQFVDAGGTLFVLADSVLIDPNTMQASENTSNVNDILEKYGVTVEKDMVYDIRSNETVNVGSGMMRYMLSYPLFVRSISHDESLSFTQNIETLVLPWASSINVDEGRVQEKGFTQTPLYQTTDFGGHQTQNYSIAPDQEFSPDGVYTLAVALNNDESGARIIVVGDADFLSDQFSGGISENTAFGMESVSWLAQDDSLAQIRLKRTGDRTLFFESESQVSWLKYGNIALVILLPLGWGFYRYQRRKRLRSQKYA